MKHAYLITNTGYKKLNQALFLRKLCIDMTSEEMYKPKHRFK